MERLNQVYAQSIREKEVFAAGKQSEYETKFSELLAEIESLKLDERKFVEDIMGVKREA